MSAARYLKAKGWRIRHRNWRAQKDGRLELDLVCRDGPVTVFVEVRARQVTSRVTGFESITRKKRSHLKQAVLAYLAEAARAGRPVQSWRFDVLSVMVRADGSLQVHHLERCRLPGSRGR